MLFTPLIKSRKKGYIQMCIASTHHNEKLIANDSHLYIITHMERCKPEILLKTTKTKMTEARSRLLDILLESKAPISANRLHELTSKETSVDLATVYRALKVFTEKGLARAVNIDGDTIYYEKACEHNPLHAHFYCENCGNVECLDPFGFEESASFLSMAKDKKINTVDMVLKGRCAECV